MDVKIANPIYDVVFKYMLEDDAVAKLLISSIIGEEVIELDPRPQERTRDKVTLDGTENSLTVYRLDFSAKIKTPEGQKLVHIEMQKASLPTDVPRFRRYLGEQYIDPRNTISTPDGMKGLQIYCIYFFGKNLWNYNAPILRSRTITEDPATSDIVDEQSDFIDALHHKSWVIQINCLKDRRRNELEQLLAVFDQSNLDKDWHILNVREEDFPEKFRMVIRRLKSAASNPEVKQQMKVEDEFLRYMQNWARELAEKGIEEGYKKSLKDLEEKDKTIEEKDKENTQLKEERAKEKEENEKLKEEIEKLNRQLENQAK
jgi:hypothetical protein